MVMEQTEQQPQVDVAPQPELSVEERIAQLQTQLQEKEAALKAKETAYEDEKKQRIGHQQAVSKLQRDRITNEALYEEIKGLKQQIGLRDRLQTGEIDEQTYRNASRQLEESQRQQSVQGYAQTVNQRAADAIGKAFEKAGITQTTPEALEVKSLVDEAWAHYQKTGFLDYTDAIAKANELAAETKLKSAQSQKEDEQKAHEEEKKKLKVPVGTPSANTQTDEQWLATYADMDNPTPKDHKKAKVILDKIRGG